MEMTQSSHSYFLQEMQVYKVKIIEAFPAMLDLWYFKKNLEAVCWFQTAVIDFSMNWVSCNYRVVGYAFLFEHYIMMDNSLAVVYFRYGV